MMYSSTVVLAILAGANGFSMTKAPTRMSSLKMNSDPWFPNTATSNVVSMDSLKYVCFLFFSSLFGDLICVKNDTFDQHFLFKIVIRPIHCFILPCIVFVCFVSAAAAKVLPVKKEAAPPKVSADGKQDFLEANPYHDQSNIPLQTFKAAAPHIGKVISVKRIVGANAVGETCDVIIDHMGKMPYWEGQSYGVVPPGTNPKNGKPYTNRLYSIASTRYGDDMKGTTTTLCVRRATYWCPELKADDPAKKGVCSNFLCDTKPGDDVMLTGPAGKVMLMPEKNPATDLIMVATGTGIAPYRYSRP